MIAACIACLPLIAGIAAALGMRIGYRYGKQIGYQQGRAVGLAERRDDDVDAAHHDAREVTS